MERWRTKFSHFLENQTNLFWGIIGFGLVGLLGLVDYLTGYELSFSLFYLAPISLVTWFAGWKFGLVISVASAIVWWLADAASGNTYSSPLFYFWNTLIRFGFFVIVTALLGEYRKALKSLQAVAQIDYITGAASDRYFYDVAQAEINRSQRYGQPISLAYIDLDNFKAVNDRFGHSTGDKVLRAVTGIIQQQIRRTDTIARLGGDEFALLLPETREEEAQSAVSRIRSCLLDEMTKNGWPVTFSVGVVIFKKLPGTVDDMVKIADERMYAVKTNGKNGVSICNYPG